MGVSFQLSGLRTHRVPGEAQHKYFPGTGPGVQRSPGTELCLSPNHNCQFWKKIFDKVKLYFRTSVSYIGLELLYADSLELVLIVKMILYTSSDMV